MSETRTPTLQNLGRMIGEPPSYQMKKTLIIKQVWALNRLHLSIKDLTNQQHECLDVYRFFCGVSIFSESLRLFVYRVSRNPDSFN